MDISPETIYKELIRAWQDTQYHKPSGKCKWKLQWDTTTQYSGYNLKDKVTAREDVETLEPSSFLLKKTVCQFLKKLKCKFTTQPSNFPLEVYPREMMIPYCPHRHVQKHS